MNDIDWDTVKVGDPDPTDNGIPDELLCPEMYIEKYVARGGRGIVLCSRLAGHDGRHVAGDGATVAAVWP